VENILVRLPGSHAEGAILLMAHYDSTPGTAGAVDNGSGVVTILEILRALQASPQLRQDVLFLFADGGESGALGARAFVTQHPWFESVRFVINMDTFKDGPPMLLRTSPDNGALIQALSHTSTRPVFASLPFQLFPAGESDILPFFESDVPGFHMQGSGGYSEIHTSLDTLDQAEPASIQHAGSQVLSLLRYMGNQPRLRTRGPDQVFFPLMGRLVHYPVSWALPLSILAALCFLGVAYYGLRTRKLTWGGTSLGLLTILLSTALSAGVCVLVWMGIQALHPEYHYSAEFRPHTSDDALYTIAFLALTLAVTASLLSIARRKIAALDLAAGTLLFWIPGAVAVGHLIPGTSYLATGVLLAGSLALGIGLLGRSDSGPWNLAPWGFLVSAIVAVSLWLPVIYITHLGLGLTNVNLLVGLIAAFMGALIPTLDWITYPKRWVLPAGALLAGVVSLGAGHNLVGRAAAPPLANPVGYWFDVDAERADWIAFTDELDERQAALLTTPFQRPYTDIVPVAPQRSIVTSQAPVLDLAGPRLDVMEDEWIDGQREMHVKITTSMHDRVYVIIPEVPVTAVTMPNNERTELLPSGKAFVTRIDGTMESFEIGFELAHSEQIQFLVVEERTGLPSFPGLSTEPQAGTMKFPGEFYQGTPADFAAVSRSFVIQALRRRK
jgi:hypothetical protein